MCILNCKRKCEQSNILDFFFFSFISCVLVGSTLLACCAQKISQKDLCVRACIWGALTTPNICPDSITNDEVLFHPLSEKKNKTRIAEIFVAFLTFVHFKRIVYDDFSRNVHICP